MAVRKIAEQPEVRERLRLVSVGEDPLPDVPSPKPTPPTREEVEAQHQRRAQMMNMSLAMLTALAKVVSARFILLLAIVGCFALGVIATLRPSVQALVVMGLFGLVTVALVLLESGLLTRWGAKE